MMNWAGGGSQPMLAGAPHLRHQGAARPDAEPGRGRPRSGPAEHGETIRTGFVPEAARDRPSGGTVGAQPGIATARCLETLPPGPPVAWEQIRAFPLVAPRQGEGRGRCAVDQQEALRRLADVGHQRGVAAPARGSGDGGGQVSATSGQRALALVALALRPVPFVAAPRPRARGSGPAHGTVDGDDACAIAQDNQHAHGIQAGDDPFGLTTVPVPNQRQVLTVLPPPRVLPYKGRFFEK
jgi:hypothetical protein